MILDDAEPVMHFGEPEAIPLELGGGLIITGPCARPHLVGKAWRWWQCQACADRKKLAKVRRRTKRRLIAAAEAARAGRW